MLCLLNARVYICYKPNRMITVNDINFSGKRALIRVDFNVPLNDELKVTDDTRIRAALPTIKKIIADGGSVVLMSHLGRPKDGPENKFSLNNIAYKINELLGVDVILGGDCIGEEAYKKSADLKAGEILLLDNLRFYKEEEKGDKSFAEKLAKHGDYYVNDAFGTAHRAHASTAIIANFFEGKKAFGLLMANEVSSLEKVLSKHDKPFTAVIGGAKVSSKISIIKHLLDKIDNLIIGGGMAYTFAVAEGGTVGNSLIENDFVNEAKSIMEEADKKGVRILLPQDTLAAKSFSNHAEKAVFPTNEIPEGWMGMDIGEEAINHYKLCLEESKTILWNGPMGVFEFSNFAEGTKQIAYGIVSGTERGAYSLVGGGDSVAAVNQLNLAEHVSYVSTGGGAMLEYLEGKVLPGVGALLS